MLVAGFSCNGNPAASPNSVANRRGIAEIALPANDKIVQGQTIYVPAYSHVYTADSAHPLNLAATLFVRNTDPSNPIILTRAEYFDSGGRSLRSFVKGPLRIDPMASIDFFVKESDETGGASPSFVVEWVATEPVAEPLAESVMIGTTGSQGISFTGTGRVIQTRKP
jgi:hypothetical protein